MRDRVVFVMLRQPDRSDPDESRSDPFYEFGFFGITGCHQTNLLSDDAAHGVRLAFIQGGPDQLRLVHVTPPVSIEAKGRQLVATWKPAEMPLRFEDAPVLVENRPARRNTALLDFLKGTNRSTPVAQFTSRFRARKEPLPDDIATEILAAWRTASTAGCRSESYIDALPYPPNRPLDARERKQRFNDLLARAGANAKPGCNPVRREPKKNGRGC
jgi:hypothetical protein